MLKKLATRKDEESMVKLDLKRRENMIKEDGTVVFEGKEQEELNRIVGERLSREGIHDMKEIVETLKEFDYTGTPQEIKAALKAQADIYKANKAEEAKQAELEALKEQAKAEGTSPELLAEIKALKAQIEAINKKEADAQKAIEEQKKANETFALQKTEFETKYPNVDLEKMGADEDFLDFIRSTSASLTLVQKYEKYVKLLGGAESKALEKFKLNSDRSTSNGKQKGEATGGTYGLTARQQALAEENGMTLKEYADSLSKIKK